MEDWVEGQGGAEKQRRSGKRKTAQESDGSDFCTARKRLPLKLLRWAALLLGPQAEDQVAQSFHGLRVLWAHGSTLRVPNMAENEKHFGRAQNGKRKSRTPVARLMVLLGAGSSAVLDYAFGPYLRSEMAMYWELLRNLKLSDLPVAD